MNKNKRGTAGIINNQELLKINPLHTKPVTSNKMNLSQFNFAKTHRIGTQNDVFGHYSSEMKDHIEIPNMLTSSIEKQKESF